jgi:hypothetical protein
VDREGGDLLVSTELLEEADFFGKHSSLALTSCGIGDGKVGVQFTIGRTYTHLSKESVERLMVVLDAWLADPAHLTARASLTGGR